MQGQDAVERQKAVQHAVALDKLMAQQNSGTGENELPRKASIRLSDGKDLINLVMGMQDANFHERKTKARKLESELGGMRHPLPKHVI